MSLPYRLQTQEIDPASPPNEAVKACIDAWNRWRGAATMPAWTGPERLLDLPAWVLPFAIVADVRPSGGFVYRFWGSGFTTLHGYDLTGKSVSDLKPKGFAEMVERSMREVCRRKAPLLYEGDYVSKNEVVGSEIVLRLPLSHDGSSVSHILTLVWIGVRETEDWFRQDTAVGG